MRVLPLDFGHDERDVVRKGGAASELGQPRKDALFNGIRTSRRKRSNLVSSPWMSSGKNFRATACTELEVVGSVDLAHAASAYAQFDAVTFG